MITQTLQRANFGGGSVEFSEVGSGDPVVLIHGSHIADAIAPLLSEPSLADRYRLILYHRRGFAGSSHPSQPLSIADHAADCRELMRALGLERAHVVGYSFGGDIALQLALDFPSAVHSLAILEPPLLFVPSAQLNMPVIGAAAGMYQSGNKAGAVDAFIQLFVGPNFRDVLDASVPGGHEQAVADADTFFTQELQALPAWRFGNEDAGRITQPVLAVLGGDSPELNPAAQEAFDWLRESLPNVEGFVLPGVTHALQTAKPREMAEALAAFFARHPMSARVETARATQN
jgi:pimeloyl-ACP methyl ester carboxylesterase